MRQRLQYKRLQVKSFHPTFDIKLCLGHPQIEAHFRDNDEHPSAPTNPHKSSQTFHR